MIYKYFTQFLLIIMIYYKIRVEGGKKHDEFEEFISG